MIDLNSCELAVLTYIKDAVAGGYAVDLDALLNVPQYLNYPPEKIIRAVRYLSKQELIEVKPLINKNPDISFIVCDVTDKGRNMI